jgi:hypothetical protein
MSAMKIENHEQIQKNLFTENKARPPQSPSDLKFGDILKDTVESRKPEAAGPAQTAIVRPLATIPPAAYFSLEKQRVLDRVENLIDLLDQYRQQLSDPSLALKEVDPAVREINQARENLTPVLDSLPEDEELKNIVNRTLVTASLEVTKFYRGDYIAV